MMAIGSRSETENNLFRLQAWLYSNTFVQVVLFLISLLVLLRTMAPTVYTLDSAELSTGAPLLGIVHAPGYPLYTVIGFLFNLLPVGDVAYRQNLYSALCVALTTPILYSAIYLLIRDRIIAAGVALTFVWSYYVWNTGVAAEINAPQILVVAIVVWSVAKMYRTEGHKGAIRTGLLFGLAVAMCPQDVFFAPGMVAAFLLMRVPFSKCVLAGVVGAGLFLATLLYFPIRVNAAPEFNKLGEYDASGVFHSFDFHSPAGIWQAISGEQFHSLFFTGGYIPTLDQVATVASWYWRNYLGVGVVLGLLGVFYLARRHPGLFIVWLAFWLPYTYFYIGYGAINKDTMLGPSYLVWSIVLAYGLWRVIVFLSATSFGEIKPYLALGLPVLAFLINFANVDLSSDTSVRDHALSVMQSLPANAIVAGYWPDIAPMQYLYYIEHTRPDVTIYDLFLFPPDTFHTYMKSVAQTGNRPMVFVTSTALGYLVGTPYSVTPVLVNSDPTDPIFVVDTMPNQKLASIGSDALMLFTIIAH